MEKRNALYNIVDSLMQVITVTANSIMIQKLSVLYICYNFVKEKREASTLTNREVGFLFLFLSRTLRNISFLTRSTIISKIKVCTILFSHRFIEHKFEQP